MERKIGETFEFEGKKIEVKAAINGGCDGCILDEKCARINQAIVGECEGDKREDRMNVTFAEVQEQQDEQPQGLNLCEILKYCPEGTQFWSPMLGDVKFWGVGESMVTVEDKAGNSWDINSDSTLTIGGVGGVTSEEPMLFPSREQRDWSKVKYKRPVEKLPKSWDGFVREMGFNPEKFTFEGLYIEFSDSMLAGGDDIDRYCDQHIAMVKLHALRDCYRQGWKPGDEKEDGTSPFSITNLRTEEGCKLKVGIYAGINRFLVFQDEEHATRFLENFRDLIEQAGDLI